MKSRQGVSVCIDQQVVANTLYINFAHETNARRFGVFIMIMMKS